jgi:hypothetical protein
MQNWPNMLTQAKVSLESVLASNSDVPTFNPSQDPTQDLLNSIIRFTTQNKGQKWLSNFEVAAMNLSVHQKVCLSLLCSIWNKYVAI